MNSYYHGTKEHPYHLSTGAVILNDKNEVCVHHYKTLKRDGDPIVYTDIYTLMRESVESGETLEQTLHRGMMEELGATGTIVTFLGSLKSQFPRDEVLVEKTTVYFLVKLKSINSDLAHESEDVQTDVHTQWLSLDDCIMKMKKQEERTGRDSFNEELILQKVKNI